MVREKIWKIGIRYLMRYWASHYWKLIVDIRWLSKYNRSWRLNKYWRDGPTSCCFPSWKIYIHVYTILYVHICTHMWEVCIELNYLWYWPAQIMRESSEFSKWKFCTAIPSIGLKRKDNLCEFHTNLS